LPAEIKYREIPAYIGAILWINHEKLNKKIRNDTKSGALVCSVDTSIESAEHLSLVLLIQATKRNKCFTVSSTVNHSKKYTIALPFLYHF
jgi:hypothetical protein